MTDPVPSALRGAVRVRRTGYRIRLGWALTELAADCAVGVGLVWLVLAPMVFVMWIVASVVTDGSAFLEATAALALLQVVGALAIGTPVATTLNLGSSVRWLEIRPTRIVMRLWCRRRAVPLTRLTEVVVRERRRYGRPGRVEVDLVTFSGTCRCQEGRRSPLRGTDSRALAGWLSELLCPAAIPVRHEYVVVPGRIARQWWPARRVAAVWGVPVDQVPEIATRWEVHTADRSGTPVYRSLEVEERAGQVKNS